MGGREIPWDDSTDEWATENPTGCLGRCKGLTTENDALRQTITRLGDEADRLHTLLASERALTARLQKAINSATDDGSGIWAEMDAFWASLRQPEAGR